MYGVICHMPKLIRRFTLLIDYRLPECNARVISQIPHHMPYVFLYPLIKDIMIFRGIKLPSGGRCNHKNSKLVTGLHKSLCLRIMTCSYNIPACFFYHICVSVLKGIGQGVSYPRIFLMTVASGQQYLLTV